MGRILSKKRLLQVNFQWVKKKVRKIIFHEEILNEERSIALDKNCHTLSFKDSDEHVFSDPI